MSWIKGPFESYLNDGVFTDKARRVWNTNPNLFPLLSGPTLFSETFLKLKAITLLRGKARDLPVTVNDATVLGKLNPEAS